MSKLLSANTSGYLARVSIPCDIPVVLQPYTHNFRMAFTTAFVYGAEVVGNAILPSRNDLLAVAENIGVKNETMLVLL